MRLPVSSEELKNIRCPQCGEEMSHGYITGKGAALRWTEKEKTKTIFAGGRLRKKIDWWNAPSVEAVRCEECKIGVFRYDY